MTELQPRADETLETLPRSSFRILQARQGYRFSLDPFLLGDFTPVAASESVLDLGTGSGILPLLLRSRGPTAGIVAVEVRPEAAARARRSMALNGVKDVEIVAGDLRQYRQLLRPESFDCVVSNPPYHRLGGGRLPPQDERAAARHELHGTLADFVAAAAWALRQGGRCNLILPAERMAAAMTLLRQAQLEPKRLRLVHARNGEPACLVLIESRRGAREGLQVESPLILYRSTKGRDYTEEARQLLTGAQSE